MNLSMIGAFAQNSLRYNIDIRGNEGRYKKINISDYNPRANNVTFAGLTKEQNEQVSKAWEEFNNKDLNSEYTGSQRWSIFLSKLEKNGLITSEERLLADGNMVVVPDPDKYGTMVMAQQYSPEEIENLNCIDQDPIKWLDYFIFYQSKTGHLARMEGYTTNGIDEQINACKKVQNIVNRLMGK